MSEEEIRRGRGESIFIPFGLQEGVGGWYVPAGGKDIAGMSQGFVYGALTSVASSIGDLAKLAAQMTLINRMKNEFIPNAANFPSDLSTRAVNLSLKDLASEVLKKVNSDYDYLTYAYNTGLQTGLGAGFASYQKQFMQSGILLQAYDTLQYQISVIPRMRRHWLSQYTPSVPDSRMAFYLWHRQAIKETDFDQYAYGS